LRKRYPESHSDNGLPYEVYLITVFQLVLRRNFDNGVPFKGVPFKGVPFKGVPFNGVPNITICSKLKNDTNSFYNNYLKKAIPLP
jgi:hypothetical protein